VEGGHVLLDADVLTERPVEGASRDRALEAGPPPTGVRAAAGLACAGQQPPLSCHEPQELALGRFSSAADAAPDRLAHADGVSSSAGPSAGIWSTGTPAGTWSTLADSGSVAPRDAVSSGMSSTLSGPMLSASGGARSARASSSGSDSAITGSVSGVSWSASA